MTLKAWLSRRGWLPWLRIRKGACVRVVGRGTIELTRWEALPRRKLWSLRTARSLTELLIELLVRRLVHAVNGLSWG